MITLRVFMTFGLAATAALASSVANAAMAGAPVLENPRATISAPHEVTGTLIAVKGSLLSLRTRTGKIVRVDDSDAIRHQQSAVLVVGQPFNIRGTYDAAGVLHAIAIVRAKPATWPPDR